MYFGIRSGALHVRDGKSGNTGGTMDRLRRGIARDAGFLSRKTPGYVSDGRDSKGTCVFHRAKLMKQRAMVSYMDLGLKRIAGHTEMAVNGQRVKCAADYDRVPGHVTPAALHEFSPQLLTIKAMLCWKESKCTITRTGL